MDLITRAVIFAAEAHDGATRKFSTSPYILHPLEAAAIAGSLTGDQEVIAAAVLHDTLEDAQVTAQTIEQTFGSRVAALVLAETEDKREDAPPQSTWMLRKQEAVERLRQTQDTAVQILYLADKLSNLRSMERDLQRVGDALWQQFNQPDPAAHAWYHRAVADATSALSDTKPWQEYQRLITTIFG